MHNRYQRFNDHLISAFCVLIRRYVDEVNERARDAYYLHRRQANEDIDQGAKLLYLFIDPDVPDKRPFGEVRAQADSLLSADRIARLCEHLAGDAGLDEGLFEWQAIDAVMPKTKRNLRPLLRFLALTGTSSHEGFLTVVRAFAEAFNEGRPIPSDHLNTNFIPERHRRYLLTAGSVHRDRYEFLIYRQLRDRIEAGDVFCTESARYRSFEDDLVDEATWAEKDRLLPQVVAQSAPINTQLENLKQMLNERFDQVNAHIQYIPIGLRVRSIRIGPESGCTACPYAEASLARA